MPRLLGIFFWPFRGWPSQSSVGPAELGEPNPRTQRPRSAAHTLAVDQAGPPPRRDPRHPRTWGRATATRAPARGLRPASRAPLPSLISLPPPSWVRRLLLLLFLWQWRAARACSPWRSPPLGSPPRPPRRRLSRYVGMGGCSWFRRIYIRAICDRRLVGSDLVVVARVLASMYSL